MSDYRRLISYIYAYEGGVKGKNIGFAKIDMRGPQCRIQVNVKKVYVGSSDIGVYLLYTGGELLLGRIFIRAGAGEFRTQVQSENVDGFGIRMEDCYGLTIHDMENAWQSYTTIWEDAVAQTAELQLAEVTAEQIRKQKEVEEPDPKLSISAEIEQELEAEEQKLETIAPWGETEMETEEAKLQADSSLQTQTMCEQEIEKQEKQPQILEEAQNKEQPVEKQEAGEPRETSVSREPIWQGPEDADRLAELDREENEELADTNIWQKMSGQYTKVLAFDYDNGCEILSIKPQDIGLLPREIWVYGNNSFLLHGYYNYRHLILAKLQDPQKPPRYLLGVPGHYFSNEKYMASMFGFPHFVLARKQPQGDGRFGYWYTDIRL